MSVRLGVTLAIAIALAVALFVIGYLSAGAFLAWKLSLLGGPVQVVYTNLTEPFWVPLQFGAAFVPAPIVALLAVITYRRRAHRDPSIRAIVMFFAIALVLEALVLVVPALLMPSLLDYGSPDVAPMITVASFVPGRFELQLGLVGAFGMWGVAWLLGKPRG
jgi:hypothetical protein